MRKEKSYNAYISIPKGYLRDPIKIRQDIGFDTVEYTYNPTSEKVKIHSQHILAEKKRIINSTIKQFQDGIVPITKTTWFQLESKNGNQATIFGTSSGCMGVNRVREGFKEGFQNRSFQVRHDVPSLDSARVNMGTDGIWPIRVSGPDVRTYDRNYRKL